MTAPTVYFIDDSATMREVIKIAFRRENIDVVACHDADTAINQMQQAPPDVVISDVIMPGKDGYEVCQLIKQTPATASIPVVLMSGVVNRSVAEKAFAVKADELIRKPFQPQDLIARVKHLLQPKAKKPEAWPAGSPPPASPAPASPGAAGASAALSSIFASPANGGRAPAAGAQSGTISARFGTPVAAAAGPSSTAVAVTTPEPPRAAASAPAAPPPSPVAVAAAVRPSMGASTDVAKLRMEILRLENLVKKLHSELQAEREYARALEEHIKTLQETE
ncbi:MAG TPA: response regulator [Terriglobales bacterium]|nr:response regulator [Terriglobales bacterium]